MDNDAVRTSADRTLVDMWIDGKSRTVSISRAAIEAHLRLTPDRAAAMTDEDRREFVRGNLKLIATAASELVRQGDGNATAVDIDVGQFTGNAAPPPTAADRRQGDRRKGSDRRKVDLGPPPSGERRRGGRDQRGS
jgi:hypothetical protein